MDKELFDLIIALIVFGLVCLYALKSQKKTEDEKIIPWYKPHITKKTIAGLLVAMITATVLRFLLF